MSFVAGSTHASGCLGWLQSLLLLEEVVVVVKMVVCTP